MMKAMRVALLLLGCLVGAVVFAAGGSPKGQWVITKDDGRALQDVQIHTIDDFLQFAELDQDGYAEPLIAEGMVVDDIKEITDGDLEAIGMTKKMHRSRFLRYAKNMRMSPVMPPKPKKSPSPIKESRSPGSVRDSPPTVTTSDGIEAVPYGQKVRECPLRECGDTCRACWSLTTSRASTCSLTAEEGQEEEEEGRGGRGGGRGGDHSQWPARQRSRRR